MATKFNVTLLSPDTKRLRTGHSTQRDHPPCSYKDSLCHECGTHFASDTAINLLSRRRPLLSCCVLHAAQLRPRRFLPVCPTLSAVPPSQLRHKSFRSWVIWASVIFQLPVLALPPVSIKILGRRRSHMASCSQVPSVHYPHGQCLIWCSFGRASPHQRKSRDSIFHPCSPTCHVLCLTGTAGAQPVLEIWSFWLDISVRVSVNLCRAGTASWLAGDGSFVHFAACRSVPTALSDNVQSWSPLRPFDGSCLTAWRVSISFQDPTCAIFCVFASPMAFPSIVVNLCASITILHVRTSPNEQMR